MKNESLRSQQARRAVVIGAGFSGLTSAFFLARAGWSVEIYESSARVGGLISTVETANGLVETAANGLLNSALVETLFEAVGVPLVTTAKSARRRYIFRGGRNRRWPIGLAATWRLASFVCKMIFARRSVAPLAGESVREWSCRTLGPETSAYLVEPGLQGIYAGDPARLSATLILGRFFAPRSSASRPPRPKIRGTVAPPNGMGQLIAALERYLRGQGVVFHFNAVPEAIRQTMGSDAAGVHQTPAAIVIATPAAAAAALLRDIDPKKATLLDAIEYAPVVTTTAFFDRTDPASKGFGVLVPRAERLRTLGILKNNFIFNDRANGCFSETWILGGASGSQAAPNPISLDDGRLAQVIATERQQIFGISDAPKALKITRWPKAIPHYTIELERMRAELNQPTRNIILMGNYLGDLGLAKILERASKIPARFETELSATRTSL